MFNGTRKCVVKEHPAADIFCNNMSLNSVSKLSRLLSGNVNNKSTAAFIHNIRFMRNYI